MSLMVHVFLLASWFCIVSNNLYASAVCPAGCRCSGNNEDAVCCLPTAQKDSPADADNIVADNLCRTDAIPHEYRWPQTGACHSSWRQLQIRLNGLSWPPSRDAILPNASTCTNSLQRLFIYGTSSTNSGLTKLDPSLLRSLLFDNTSILALTNFTVQQTEITDIQPGFFVTLRTPQLTDVKISHNPHLTNRGLGIGWLGNTPLLRRLDLSRNALTSVDLARWGFSLTRPSALATLILSDNQITHLRAETFSRVVNLVKLDLSGNLLTDLPLDVFQGLVHLKILNLRGNHLTVTGLQIDSLNLMTALPSLRQLNLSRNPLLITSNFAKWWLTGHCPNALVDVDMEDLTSPQPMLTASATLFLPPIAWSRCPSLVHVALTQNRMLPCLPQHWVGLPPSTLVLPDRLHIRPSALQLCPPVTQPVIAPPVIAPPERPSGPDHLSHKPPSQVAISGNRAILGDTISISSDDNMHVIKLPTASFALWLGLAILALLCIIFLVVGICLCVFRVFPARKKQKSGLYQPGKQNEYQPFLSPNGQFVPTTACYVPAPSPPSHHQTVYSPVTWSADANLVETGNLQSYPCTPKRLNQANLRLLSTTDSGLDDNTPMTVQYSLDSGRSPASSTQTSLVGDSRHRQASRVSPDSVYVRVPTSAGCYRREPKLRNSFSSPRSLSVYPAHARIVFDHPSQVQLVGGSIAPPNGLVVPTSATVPVTQVLLGDCWANCVPRHPDDGTQTATDYASLGPTSTTNCCDSTPNTELANTNSSSETNDPVVSPPTETTSEQRPLPRGEFC